MSEHEVWGNAAVSFPGWKGTAQLDQRMTGPYASADTLVGLDCEKRGTEWTPETGWQPPSSPDPSSSSGSS